MASTVSSKSDSSCKENLHLKGKTTMSTLGNRKSLHTLQLSASGNRLIGKETGQTKKPAKQIPFNKEPVRIFHDTKAPEAGTQTPRVEEREEGTQTDVSGATGVRELTDHNDSGVGAGDFDQEAYDLMVKEPIPETYWRDLAEERRLSLAEALVENEQLHQSMEELKEENQNLSLLASQAEHLASILNDALDEDSEDKTETDDQEEKKSSEALTSNNTGNSDVSRDCQEPEDSTECCQQELTTENSTDADKTEES